MYCPRTGDGSGHESSSGCEDNRCRPAGALLHGPVHGHAWTKLGKLTRDNSSVVVIHLYKSVSSNFQLNLCKLNVLKIRALKLNLNYLIRYNYSILCERKTRFLQVSHKFHIIFRQIYEPTKWKIWPLKPSTLTLPIVVPPRTREFRAQKGCLYHSGQFFVFFIENLTRRVAMLSSLGCYWQMKILITTECLLH